MPVRHTKYLYSGANLRQRVVDVNVHAQAGGCNTLRAVLILKQLIDVLRYPVAEKRKLEILAEGRYRTLLNDVLALLGDVKLELFLEMMVRREACGG